MIPWALAAPSHSHRRAAPPLLVSPDEFVGPFPSWSDLKSLYGAVGNGVADDTDAFNSAYVDLGSTIATVYLPAGTYRITDQTTLAARIYVNIIGEDPANTTIIWDGDPGGTMLFINGVSFSRYSRITFDGRGIAGFCVDQSRESGSFGFFDTGIEWSDCVFQDAGVGLAGGIGPSQGTTNEGWGFADVAMLRNKFLRCSIAGISLGNQDALDVLIWYNLFEDCYRGISCANHGELAGDFRAYGCIFRRCSNFDMLMSQPAGIFSVRDCFSTGGRCFFSGTVNGGPAQITLQGNRIITDVANPQFCYIGNLGPTFLIDNQWRGTLDPSAIQAVVISALAPEELFSINNKFHTSVGNVWNLVDTRHHSIDDEIVAFEGIDATEPILPGFLPNYNRQIFEVPPGSTAAQAQAVIDLAALENGNRVVVHLPPSVLLPDTTLIIPAENDMQIVGDGGRSVLRRTDGGLVMRLLGPTKATLRDFLIDGVSQLADGIVVEDCDQPGSRVWMEQYLLGGNTNNLIVNQLDYTLVELHDCQSYSASTSLKVIGGPSAAAGTWLGGKTNLYGGISTGQGISFEPTNGAHLVIWDIWSENGSGFQKFLKLTGDSDVTVSAANVAGTGITIDIVDYHGRAFLSEIRGAFSVPISGDCTGAEIFIQGFANYAPYPVDTSSPAATVLFLNNMEFVYQPDRQADPLPESGTYSEPFIRSMLEQLRAEKPTTLAPTGVGVTDFRLYRVFCLSCVVGIQLNA